MMHRIALFLLAALLFFSCQKEFSIDNGSGNLLPDFETKISSSVSGFVTDENDAAVAGATVQIGAGTFITDQYGYFEAKNVQVVKNAAVVTVSKRGYFKGIKTYISIAGKAAFFRIKLIPKAIAGNVNGGSGGTVTLANGLSINLPAGAVMNAATNSAYTGTVNIAAFWINPEAADLNSIMPGDLRGVDNEGSMKLLQTFGMAAVELSGASGELLQIATGKKATVTFPIPSSLSASAPASIPLWFFNEARGLWKEEGVAVKTGNSYVGDVSHFSFWNCDVPGDFVQFNCTLKNSSGDPLFNVFVKITVAGTNNSAVGYTDSSGYVNGVVPGNSNLVMKAFINNNCTTPLYSQTFTTTNVNISLGNFTVSNPINLATITGTVTNCAGNPVTNGHIILREGNAFTRYPLNNLGEYSFSKNFCSYPQTVTLIGEDITNQQQSTNISFNVHTGTNMAGTIQACGVSIQQFVNYNMNGTTHSFTTPLDTFEYSNWHPIALAITAYNPANSQQAVAVSMEKAGMAVGSSQKLRSFWNGADTMYIIPTPIFVNITEYGTVGQFVAGNFTGIVSEIPPSTVQHLVTWNFRVRRIN